ncbi:MAG: hypothetical protein HY255_03000, partial [Betaproteobacteria bacterium]|nr:hypothetical protein [Betaproteobacteria bacterium]
MNDRSFSSAPVVPTILPDPQTANLAETLDLIEYWRSITKRKWSIIGLVLLISLIATLVVYSLRPSYRSTTTILIEQGKSK